MKTRVVRISQELLPYIDAAINQMRNELGVQLFKYRSEVVSAAVREFIKNHNVRLEGAHPKLEAEMNV